MSAIEVSRYLARVAYVTGADTATRKRLAALDGKYTSVDALPAWVPRPPAGLDAASGIAVSGND
jgi:hypothetical protein